ncbi:MAG: serine protease [Chitinivibrionales bacterium]|nr:serine protease [Chitinivibrionales bacterium]
MQLLGVIVIIAEFILPSAGLLTVAALGLFGYSLYIAFAKISTSTGFIFAALDVILIPVSVLIGLKILAKSNVTHKTSLQGTASQSDNFKAYLGKEGVVLSDLRPSGMATIEGKRVDVVTHGEYIEEHSPVIVTEIAGNQIVVELKES